MRDKPDTGLGLIRHRPLDWSHAKEKPHEVESSNEEIVHGHDQCKGDHRDDQKLRQNAYIQVDDKPTNAKNNRLV